MDLDALFQRISSAVDQAAYLTPTDEVDPRYRDALDAVAERLRQPTLDVDGVRALIRRLYDAGHLDRFYMLSALHVVAADPRVADHAQAARLAGEQEQAALELGGPRLPTHLASVDRHRGVLAFLSGAYEVALDHFTRALERRRTVENLGNVLAALIRLGELDEARSIATTVRHTFRDDDRRALDHRIATDPDLARLRAPAPSLEAS